MYELQMKSLRNKKSILVEILLSITITLTGSISFGTSSLIISKGLILPEISETLTDDEKVAAADEQLSTNRAN